MLSHNLEKLEYPKILNLLMNYAKTYIGKELCLSLVPFSDSQKVSNALKETSQAVRFSYQKGNPPIGEIPNITLWIKTLDSNMPLSAKALLELAMILKIGRELKTCFFQDDSISRDEFSILEPVFSSLYQNETLEKKVFSSIIDEVTIDDHASSYLAQIRRKKRNREEQIKEKLNSFLHSSSHSKQIQEPVITIRNDRFVIPIKEEYRSYVKGFVHGISSSGSTVFIEPMVIFELNNELNTLKIEEAIEIEKILEELSSLFHPLLKELENTVSSIGKLDFIFAKAAFATSYDAVEPLLNDAQKINLIQARHPLISKEVVVPIDLHLGFEFSSLVITGPNTGGKTVTLKTTGLLVLMGMSGLFIPAKEGSSICMFDHVFADIGDEQSIQESLSTFSSHMLNLIEILKDSTKNSLVLVDELGSGTDPIEGSSLAISILEELFHKKALTVATTHYPEIKNYALVTDGFENASQQFDIENLRPTYQLLIGLPGKSNAFAISRRLGLDEKILARANELISKQDISIEELLKNIYDDKIKLEKEKEEIEKNLIQITDLRNSLEQKEETRKERETVIIEKAKQEARDILTKAKQEATSMIRTLHCICKEQDSIKNLNQIRNQLNDSIKDLNNSNSKGETPLKEINSLSIEEIKLGMSVLVVSLNQDAIVLTLPNKSKEVLVQIGSLKMNISISDLAKSKNANRPKSSVSTNSNHKLSNLKTKTASTEINVIGQTVEEAIFVIDKFLDDAALSKLSNVRIVHGKGTGKLRTGIHAFLKKNPHVASYRMGTFGEGEMGVTIVEIK